MIERFKGDSYPMEWLLKINNTPIDLTGYVVTFTFKDDTGNNVLNGAIDADQVTNPGKVVFDVLTTTFGNPGVYKYEVEGVYDPTGANVVRTFTKDEIKIIGTL